MTIEQLEIQVGCYSCGPTLRFMAKFLSTICSSSFQAKNALDSAPFMILAAAFLIFCCFVTLPNLTALQASNTLRMRKRSSCIMRCSKMRLLCRMASWTCRWLEAADSNHMLNIQTTSNTQLQLTGSWRLRKVTCGCTTVSRCEADPPEYIKL